MNKDRRLIPEFCDCDCHQNMSMHFMPCCITCSICKKNVNKSAFNAHKEKCQDESKPN